MKLNDLKRRLTALSLQAILAAGVACACTSAIISGRLTHDGRPLLWKNRDTSALDNFVARVEPKAPGDIAYIALFNSADTLLSEAWTGVNAEGFAVMNTASYNLPVDSGCDHDLEGVLMSLALRTCHSLADFEAMLDSLPKPLGVEANFGAIDAGGNAAYYETSDHGWRKYDVGTSKDGYAIRTNYSYSGEPDAGFGYIREQNALTLIAPLLERGALAPRDFTDGLSRSFYHSLFGTDALADTTAVWAVDQDFIPRHSTSASVAVSGRGVMTVALGYPPCAETMTATVDSVPADLLPGDDRHSAAADRAMSRKRRVFPIVRGSGPHYIYLPALRHITDSLRHASR